MEWLFLRLVGKKNIHGECFFGDNAPRENRADGGYSIKDSWIRAVDDIEKVQQIEIRHSRYNYKKIPFNFKHLLEFGQDKESQTQRPELFDKFEQAWQKEIKRKDVKFFVLNLGTKFPDFQNKKCNRPDLFEKIRNEDWGTIYKKPYNFFSKGQLPQSECGPYFVYLFDELQIEKRTQEIEIVSEDSEEEQGGVFQQKQASDYRFLPSEIPKDYVLQGNPRNISEDLKEELKNTKFQNAYSFVWDKDNKPVIMLIIVFSSEKQLEKGAYEIYQPFATLYGDKTISFLRFFKNNTTLIFIYFEQPDEVNDGVSEFITGVNKYKTRLGLEEIDFSQYSISSPSFLLKRTRFP